MPKSKEIKTKGKKSNDKSIKAYSGTNEVFRFQWPSTENLGTHLAFKFPENINLLDKQVLMTEKLDGQNVSRVYSVKDKKIIETGSRTRVIENYLFNGEDISFIQKYDENIFELFNKLKNLLPFDYLIVSGELLLETNNFRRVSDINYGNNEKEWRVFGFTVYRYDVGTTQFINEKYAKILVDCGFTIPKIIFKGLCRDGIKYCDNIMDYNMEGVMISALGDDNFNYKYKVGKFDERRTNKIIDEDIVQHLSISNEDLELLKMIENMYNRREVARGKKPKKDKTKIKSIDDRYNLYVSSQLSKISLDIPKIYSDPEFRKQQISEIEEDVYQDILKNNDLDVAISGLDLNREIIKKKVGGSIGTLVGKYKKTIT